jgi:2-polyprenyl-6-methoxyphenol hydroxylase-like FAD-dependent oxidoreductase
VRSLLALDWRATGPSELFAVFEFSAEGGPPVHEARFTTDAAGTSVLWPLPGGRWRWSLPLSDDGAPMWRTKSRLAVTIGETLDANVLPFMLKAHLPWFEGTPKDVLWATTARFERRVAGSFGRNRTWLAGDAAHLGVPLGVQSMNAGLREGSAIADCLAAIVHGRIESPLSLLEAYGESARAEWNAHADEPIVPLSAPLPQRQRA